jgi:hypothetical protein
MFSNARLPGRFAAGRALLELRSSNLKRVVFYEVDATPLDVVDNLEVMEDCITRESDQLVA